MKRDPKTRRLPTRVSGPAESAGFALWNKSNAWQRRRRVALNLMVSPFAVRGAGDRHVVRRQSLTGTDLPTLRHRSDDTSQVLRALEAAR